MQVTVFTSDRGRLNVDSFDAESAMDFAEELREGEAQFLTLVLDDESTVLVNRDHIVRVDIDS